MLVTLRSSRDVPSLPVRTQNGTATLGDSFSLTKLNILLPYDPAITLLGIHPKKLKAYVHTKTCTQMFRAALFIIVKTWKQPRHPSVGEWIKKKKQNCDTCREWNSIQYQKEMSHQDMNRRGGTLKFLLLSEGSLSEKATYCIIPTIWHSRKKQNCGDCKRSFQWLLGVGRKGDE